MAPLANATLTLSVTPSVSYDGNFTLSWSGGTTFVNLYYQSGQALCTQCQTSGSIKSTGAAPGYYGYYGQDCYHPPSNVPPICQSPTNSVGVQVVGPQPVYIKPKYQVVGVYYAPPGMKSTATYSAGFNSGTSTNVSSSFNVATKVAISVTGGSGWDLGLFKIGGNSSAGVSGGWTQQQDSSSTVTLTSQSSSGTIVPGPGSSGLGVNHDYDVIWVWLNPEIELVPSSTQVLISSYAIDSSDPLLAADVVPIYVGELKGTLAMPADLQYRLQRPWDSSLGALNAADYADILAADPFAKNPSFDPNSDTSGRYERPRSAAFPNGNATAVNYVPAPTGAQALCYPYSFTATSTSAIGQGAKDTHSVGFSIDMKATGGILGNTLALDTKVSNTLTTTNSWSQTNSSGTSQTASFQICGPLAADGYTGYTAMQVWKDNVYGTYMFYPEP